MMSSAASMVSSDSIPETARRMKSHISWLPVEVIAHILSLTSPRDACAAAAASTVFRSAAGYDAVWERFLPPDYRSILSRAVDNEVAFSSKKELFSRLCRPLLIDGGTKSFALDKSTGKKCFMLSTKELKILRQSSPSCRKWTSHPKSRFSEAIVLLDFLQLKIVGRLKAAELSPKTTYVAYFIFRLQPNSNGFYYFYQEARVTLGEQISRRSVSLQIQEKWKGCIWPKGKELFHARNLPQEPVDVKHFPRPRSDGWMELPLGEFFNDDRRSDFDEVVVKLLEVKFLNWKRGLIVEGIEFRPKN